MNADNLRAGESSAPVGGIRKRRGHSLAPFETAIRPVGPCKERPYDIHPRSSRSGLLRLRHAARIRQRLTVTRSRISSLISRSTDHPETGVFSLSFAGETRAEPLATR